MQAQKQRRKTHYNIQAQVLSSAFQTLSGSYHAQHPYYCSKNPPSLSPQSIWVTIDSNLSMYYSGLFFLSLVSERRGQHQRGQPFQ